MLAESIKLVLVKRNMSKAELARKLGCSTSNLYNKLSRNNFSEQEMNKIAEVLDCHFEASLVLNDTGERF
jgi:DNA-binding Xre family transcriptional regulator